MRAASPGSRLPAEPRGWPGSRWFTVHRSQAHRRAEWEVGSEQVGAARDGLPGVLGTSPRLHPPVDGVTQCVGLLSTSPRPGGWVPRGCQSDGMWPLTEHDRQHAPSTASRWWGQAPGPLPGQDGGRGGPSGTAQRPRSRALPPGALAGTPASSGHLLWLRSSRGPRSGGSVARGCDETATHGVTDVEGSAAQACRPGAPGRSAGGGGRGSEGDSGQAAVLGALCRSRLPPAGAVRVTVPAGVSEAFPASYCDTRWVQSPPWSHRISP